VDWEAAGAAGAAKDWQMGNASAEEAVMAAGGSAKDCPGAPLATTHGPAAEVLYEGAECDLDMGNAAEACDGDGGGRSGGRWTGSSGGGKERGS